MHSRKRNKINSGSSRFIVVVSVTLLLMLMGGVVLAGFGCRVAADDLHGRIGFVALIDEEVTGEECDSLVQSLSAQPYSRNVSFTSADEVLAQWREATGMDADVAGDNPFLREVEVRVNKPWDHPDSVAVIVAALEEDDMIYDVEVQDDVVHSVLTTVNSIMIGAIIVAIVLLVAVIILIHNTVQLALNARRFAIYAMQLVGATPGFIRKPFVVSAVWQGLIASVLAVVILGGVYAWSIAAGVYPLRGIPVWELVCVAAGLLITGPALCALATLIAINRYLRTDYDDMF